MRDYQITTIGDLNNASLSTSSPGAFLSTLAAQKVTLAVGLAGGLALGWFFFRRGRR